jgi:hypothetical protein
VESVAIQSGVANQIANSIRVELISISISAGEVAEVASLASLTVQVFGINRIIIHYNFNIIGRSRSRNSRSRNSRTETVNRGEKKRKKKDMKQQKQRQDQQRQQEQQEATEQQRRSNRTWGEAGSGGAGQQNLEQQGMEAAGAAGTAGQQRQQNRAEWRSSRRAANRISKEVAITSNSSSSGSVPLLAVNIVFSIINFSIGELSSGLVLPFRYWCHR